MGLNTFPVDKDGNMLRNVYRYWRWNSQLRRREPVIAEHELWPNDPFPARMSYQGYWRGSSAICFEWKDELGHKFPMFMTDMNKLVSDGAIINGAVWGKWQAVKRGRYYGIQLVPDAS
ncbi:hypothetical protein GCM10010149_88880 [Nonomuraea roseoviolacea subsp. roseoviolacea]|uniref:hypothetical protein n=1 Tax=Nonomuraea roseoviolacea TaxID=103837 RepID=UPI0031DFF553